jgi:hypothetical protein
VRARYVAPIAGCFVLALAFLLAVALPGRRALAAARQPSLQVTVIHAMISDAGGSIDPLLRDLPQLGRDQPFVRYNVYKLLDRKELALDPGKPAVTALPNGRVLQVTLVDEVGDGPGRRFHVRAEIGEPGKTAFLKLLEVTASPNEPFFVGGQSYQGGTLFLELAVRP